MAPQANDTTTTSESVTVGLYTPPDTQLVEVDSTQTSESVGYYTELVATREHLTLTSILTIHAQDTTATSEAINFFDVEIENVSDATVTSESVTVAPTSLTNPLPLSDTTVTSENIGLDYDINAILSDSTATSEFITIIPPTAGTFNISAIDSTATSESVSPLLPVETLGISDTTTTSETVGHYTDLVATREVVSFIFPKTATAHDTTTTSETVHLTLNPLLINIQDTRLEDESGAFILDEAGNYINSEGPTERTITSETIGVNIYPIVNSLSILDSTVTTESIMLAPYYPGAVVIVRTLILTLIVPNELVFNIIRQS